MAVKKETFKVGDIVQPIKNKDYKGNTIMRYDSTYIIMAIRDGKATLSAKRGELLYYWATLDLKNIKKVEE